MTNHASVHYLFAAVQNIRNNLSDTLTMLVIIDTMFESVNVLRCIWGLKLTYYVTCTFLVLVSLLCSTNIAALHHRKHSWFLCLLLSASLGVFLSLLSLYCSPLHRRRSSVSIQHDQWTLPSIIQLTHAKLVIYSDNSPWHKSLYIPNNANSNICRLLILNMNHYTYQIWQSSNLCHKLMCDTIITITQTKYGKAVI